MKTYPIYIPAEASDDLLHARAAAWAAEAIAAELIRNLKTAIKAGNDAEAARKNGNGNKDNNTPKGREQS